MTIEDRMSFILNDIFRNEVYRVKIEHKHSFRVYKDELMIQSTITIKDVYSHWRDFARDIVMVIINERIKKALNEV